jgi:uncharacterized protein (TIGR03118 family)
LRSTFSPRSRFFISLAPISFLALSFLIALPGQAQTGYLQTNLVSDIPGLAANTDPNLKNAWGIASSATSPFWVSDNGTGLATLYNSSGTPQALVVTVPAAGSASGGTPTGMVFNGSTDFQISTGTAARFIFATEDGTISGWASGTQATVKVDNAPTAAVYKGIALGNNGSGNFLYAANFHSSAIDVFNGTYTATTLAGSFTDPGLPAGYSPFNIQNLGGTLYVTYAVHDATGHDDVAGPGNGVVDRFDLNGNFLGRVVSQGGLLNSPWGLAIAPAGFGTFANDLLVGNFGDGRINVYDPVTGAFIGTLKDPNGVPITIDGLWGLRVGNGGNGGDPNKVYFSAGPNDESDGLFGSLAFVPEPGSVALLALGGFVLILLRRKSDG